jgi:hypothetical protein
MSLDAPDAATIAASRRWYDSLDFQSTGMLCFAWRMGIKARLESEGGLQDRFLASRSSGAEFDFVGRGRCLRGGSREKLR